MKKKILFIISIFIGLLALMTNFPKGTYKLNGKSVNIEISIKDNLLTFKDPQYIKRISIQDNDKNYTIKFWSETADIKLFKRKSGSDFFWVIEDKYRGISRTENIDFTKFTCWDCSGIEKTNGINILRYEFKNNKWQKKQIIDHLK